MSGRGGCLQAPTPRLILPRYETSEIFAIFLDYLGKQGCTMSRQVRSPLSLQLSALLLLAGW